MVARNEHAHDTDCPICQAMLEDGGRWSTLRQELARIGYHPPAAEDVDEAGLSEVLWELIGKLAELDVFLQQTDHLDDPALYRVLVEVALTQEGVHTEGGTVYLVLGSPETQDRLGDEPGELAVSEGGAPVRPLAERQRRRSDRDHRLPGPGSRLR